MKYKKIKLITISIVAILILTSISTTSSARIKLLTKNDIVEDTGTIKQYQNNLRIRNVQDTEYYIEADKGTEFFGILFKKYLPLNLPEEFKIDDLKVRFTGEISLRDLLTTSVFHCLLKRVIPIKLTNIETIDGNLPPYADFTYNPSDPTEGENILFDASYSSDDKEIVEYYWIYKTVGIPHLPEFMGYGENLEYSWENPGDYEVTLRVTDDDGLNNAKTEIIHVNEISEVNLDFDLSVNDIYFVGDQIPVTATITNRGESTIKVSDISIVAQSLDFEITTPDGKTLHYTGPLALCIPSHITLSPNDQHSIVINLKNDPFGEKYGEQYDFTLTGEYEIKGIYHSFSGSCGDSLVGWEGYIESPVYEFIIKKNVKQFCIYEPSEGDILQGLVTIHGATFYVSTLPNVNEICVSIDRGEWFEVDIYGLGLLPNPTDQVRGIWWYTFDTTKVNNGEHRISVRAWNGIDYSYETINVTVDNPPEPKFFITSPSEGDRVKGRVTINFGFNLNDIDEADYIEISIDRGEWIKEYLVIGCGIDEDGNTKCMYGAWYDWDTTKFDNGEHKIQARFVYAASGNYVYASPVNVIVDNHICKLTEFDNGTTIYLKEGDILNLTLVTNPSTGYSWDLEPYDESIIRHEVDFYWGYPYCSADGNKSGCFTGAPLKRTWIFEAIGNGQTKLELKYLYWNGEVGKNFAVDVIVNNIYYLDESDDGSSIYLNGGDQINLTLVTNPSAGLTWYLEPYDTSILNLIDDHSWGYPTCSGDGNIVGCPSGGCGKRTWIFEAMGNGQTKLELRHLNSGDVFHENFIVDVFVNSNPIPNHVPSSPS